MEIKDRVESSLGLVKFALEMAKSVPPSHPRVIRRVEVPISPVDFLRELERVGRFGKYYWCSRDKYFEMAGWGEADVITGNADDKFSYEEVFSRIEEKLGAISFGVKYFGGFKFNPLDGRGDRWKSFKSYRFVVPLLEIVRRGREFFLCANLILGNSSDLLKQIYILLDYISDWVLTSEMYSENGDCSLGSVKRVDTPDFEEWRKLILRALNTISQGGLKKVVMARETTFHSDGELKPITLLSKVISNGENSYIFCFHPVPERAFIGLSPECLFKVISTYLETEAVAGTAPKNSNEMDEAKNFLLSSTKELHEHTLVVEGLRDVLSSLTTHFSYSNAPEILELPHLLHLCTRFRGILRKNISRATILKYLHPTPAIGGYPKDASLEWLRENEPIDRGIYGGPVGWVAYDSAEFCVGIRCALVQRNEISLYAGAGIVEGSNPDSEWNELEGKIKSFLNIIPPQ